MPYSQILKDAVKEAVLSQKGRKIGAEKLLPLTEKTLQFLVARASLKKTTDYTAVSEHLGLKTPKWANVAFGAIGQLRLSLSKEGGFANIPDITSIVTHRGKSDAGTGAIGHGAQEVLGPEQKRTFDFEKWNEILALVTDASLDDLSTSDAQLEAFAKASSNQTGKSPEHQRLQDWIEKNCSFFEFHLMGKLERAPQQEYQFWSLDRLDVLFRTDEEWLGVEVKPSGVPQGEIRKGIYQVVKYRALLSAQLLVQSLPRSSRCILILGGELPKSLVPLASRLQVHVVECLMTKIAAAR